jgi:hypothetical protein
MRHGRIQRATPAIIIALVLAWVVPSRVPVAAQQACAAAYQTATSAIAAGATGQGVLMKLTTKVANAWRMFQDGHLANSLNELDVALNMLAGEPTKQIPDTARAQIIAAIGAFRECLAAGQPPSTATLTVRTFLLDETQPDQKGEPAGEGVYIRIDGATIGQTGADGTLTAQVPAATILVQAIVPSFSIGQATVTLAPGSSGEVSLVLDDGKQVIEDTDLVLQELADGVVPSTFVSFTLRFDRGGTPVALDTIDLVELLDRNGDIIAELKPLFSLSGGAMSASNLDALRNTLLGLAAEPIAIRAQGVDAQGFTHAGTVRFRLGVVRLVGVLTPPPSNTALAVAGIEVRVTLLGTPVVLTRVSDANGRFEIASMPIGNVGFDSQTEQNGQFYYGQGTLFLTSDRSVSLVMRHVSDVIAGVPPLSSGPIGTFATLAAEPEPDPETAQARLAANAAAAGAPSASAQAIAQATTASINVAAGPQNVPISQTATLDVPRGTKTVKLVYSVFSFEYPFYVLQQSIFNDVWSLSVFGGAAGQQLFQITRNVNSQVSTPPIWQGDSSTGQITETLNVEALAANADTTLTLFGSSMNIGDSLLTTIVTAELTAEADLTINAVEPDTVNPTTGDSSYYSIPRSGDRNVFERWFTLRITKPDQANVTQVRVILRGAGDLQQIYEEAPGPNVQVVDNERLRVRVTYQTATSTVNSIPPPIHQITYRFRVQADFNGQTLEDERDSGIRRGLWRMPNGFARYGARDVGLDDWASRGAYLWMQTNAALLTRIDDISGEHARDIGHQTHERGVDIDEFHYYTFPGGGGSGGANYTALTTNVFNAMNGDAAAAGRVGDWVTATRNGLAALHALNTVNRLYYAIGNAGQRQVTPTVLIRLNGGWAQALVQNGTVTAASGQVLNTNLGAWALANSNRITYNAVHNSHVHVALNSAALPQ